MKTSCLSHPSENRFSILRQDYWSICETSELSQTARACAAKLLNVFEQWMNSRLQNTEQVKRSNRAAEAGGFDVDIDGETNLWVYESAKDLQKVLIDEHPVKTIRQALNWLVEQNLLLRRRNPNWGGDRVYQYMLNTSEIQDRIDDLSFPHRQHRISPQATQSSPQGTSVFPAGHSNTIDSFLDSDINSEREEREALSPKKALSEQRGKSGNKLIDDQSASLLIKQKGSADDGKTSSETSYSAAPNFSATKKDNATARFEAQFKNPQRYPGLEEAGHGDIMVGSGRTDFAPGLVAVAVFHLKKYELPHEAGDAKRFILNRIKEADWAAIDLLKEAAAQSELKRKQTEAAIAASASTGNESYDTTRYYIPEPPVVDWEARRRDAQEGVARIKAMRSQAQEQQAS